MQAIKLSGECVCVLWYCCESLSLLYIFLLIMRILALRTYVCSHASVSSMATTTRALMQSMNIFSFIIRVGALCYTRSRAHCTAAVLSLSLLSSTTVIFPFLYPVWESSRCLLWRWRNKYYFPVNDNRCSFLTRCIIVIRVHGPPPTDNVFPARAHKRKHSTCSCTPMIMRGPSLILCVRGTHQGPFCRISLCIFFFPLVLCYLYMLPSRSYVTGF